MFYTYILRSVHFGTYYIGVTADVDKRFEQHNRGRVRSTKFKKPWILICSKSFKTLGAARSFENELKSIKRRQFLEDIIKHF